MCRSDGAFDHARNIMDTDKLFVTSTTVRRREFAARVMTYVVSGPEDRPPPPEPGPGPDPNREKTLQEFMKANDFQGFNAALNKLVAARLKAERDIVNDPELRASVVGKQGAADLYEPLRRFWPIVTDAFVTAVLDEKVNYVRAMLARVTDTFALIGPGLAYEYMLKKQQRYSDPTAANQIVDMLWTYIQQLGSQPPRRQTATDTKYVSVPAKLLARKGYALRPAVPNPPPRETSVTVAAAVGAAAISGVMYGYGAEQLDYADETLVLARPEDVQMRLQRLALLDGRQLQAKASSITGAGAGLFLGPEARALRAGDMITAFDGERVSRAAAERLMHEGHGAHVRSLWPGRGWAVHGWTSAAEAAGKPAGSLANDTVDVCESLLADEPGTLARHAGRRHNCKYVLITDAANAAVGADQFEPARAHIVLVATRPVRPGDELFVDYGPAFWRLELDTGAPNMPFCDVPPPVAPEKQ